MAVYLCEAVVNVLDREIVIMGNFNDTPILVVRKKKLCGKYAYIRSAKELLKDIAFAVYSLYENKVKIIIHLSVVLEYPVVFLYIFWLCLRLF